MSNPTDDNRNLLTVVATVRAKPGAEEEMRALLEAVVEPTRGEDGCVTYVLHQGAADPAVFVFYEDWVSQAHLDAHLASPHIAEGLTRLAELADGDVQVIPLRRVA